MKHPLCQPYHCLVMLNLTAVILFVLTLAAPAATIVDPARFNFTVKPGSRTTGTIKITNPSAQTANIKAVIYDWTLNAQDKMLIYPAGTRKESLKGLIKFNPQNFKLTPGASQIVRFTLTPPAGPGYLERRGIVFFEEHHLKYYPKRPGPGANIITQVGATIYLGLDGMKMGFNLENLAVVKSAAKNYQALMSINNSGDGHIRYWINYKIINDKGALVKREQLSEKVILPQFKRKVCFDLPKIQPGKYNLLCVVSFIGTEKTLNRNITFTVSN
jgi:hypothetical protein